MVRDTNQTRTDARTELTADEIHTLNEGDEVRVVYDSTHGGEQSFTATVYEVVEGVTIDEFRFDRVSLKRDEGDLSRRRLYNRAGSMDVEGRRTTINGAVWGRLNVIATEPRVYLLSDEEAEDDDEDSEEDEDAEEGNDPETATTEDGDRRFEVPEEGDEVLFSYTGGDGRHASETGVVEAVRVSPEHVEVETDTYDREGVYLSVPLGGDVNDRGELVGFTHGYAADAWTLHSLRVTSDSEDEDTDADLDENDEEDEEDEENDGNESDPYPVPVVCPECGEDAAGTFYVEEVEVGGPTNTHSRGAVAPNYRTERVRVGEYRCNACGTRDRTDAASLERRDIRTDGGTENQ